MKQDPQRVATVRIRIYSKLYGVEDFVGSDYNKLVLRAHQSVAAYTAAGVYTYYVGRI
jgi:hypothetical protein